MIRFDLTAPTQALTSAFGSLSTYVYGVAFLVTLIGYYAQVWRHRREPSQAIEALVTMRLRSPFGARTSSICSTIRPSNWRRPIPSSSSIWQ
jgi:hypothetical protein